MGEFSNTVDTGTWGGQLLSAFRA